MRYRFLFISLLLSLSACTFQVNVLTPEPSVGSEFATSTPYPPEMGILTASPSSFPTFTSTPAITPSPIPRNPGTTPIRFAPNGTYIDVVDTILVGTSKTYSISALKGQVMSISVHQSEAGNWTVVPIEISGADGTTLCPQPENRECYFWRGALPVTQDYFVTLTPSIDVADFTLRVAINPPGMPTQSFQYLGASRNISLSYTDAFAPARFPGAAIYKVTPGIVLDFIDTQYYANTNLDEAYFLFGSTHENNIVESCTQPVSFGGPERVVSAVNINGIKFVRSEGSGVALGSIYEQIYHRATYQGVCYEVTFFFHYANIGNYMPDAGIKEFDRTALLQKFEGILATLIIK